MVKIYYNLITKKLKTIEEVPSIIREDVIKMLNDNGYDVTEIYYNNRQKCELTK